MKFDNKVSFKVSGVNALFTDPLTKIGGEKSTLMVPTYQSLKAICESIYWKPSITWIVDKVTVLKPIVTERKGIRPIKYNGGNDLAYYTYLRDVAYIVEAHFEFNKNRMDLKEDWNENKHYYIMKRCISRGGRRDVYLGTRECQAYVEEVDDIEESYYKNMGTMEFGFMYHSFSYPDENGRDVLESLFWRPKMENGVIRFCRPEECEQRLLIKEMSAKKFDDGNFVKAGEEDPDLLVGYKEEVGRWDG